MILLGVIVGSTVAIVICCRPVYVIPGKFKKKLKNFITIYAPLQ